MLLVFVGMLVEGAGFGFGGFCDFGSGLGVVGFAWNWCVGGYDRRRVWFGDSVSWDFGFGLLGLRFGCFDASGVFLCSGMRV